jgi:hypothetical protein
MSTTTAPTENARTENASTENASTENVPNEEGSTDKDAYSPYRVEATLEEAKVGLRVRFEQDGEEVTNLLQFSTDREVLEGDAIPNEDGIGSMEEAIQEANKGWEVDILIHEERARMWAVPDLVF